VTWAPLLKLGRMARLRSLLVSFPDNMHDGTGLQYLARSVDGLSGLQSLEIDFVGPFKSESSLAARLPFIGCLGGLSKLTLRGAPSMAPPAWLSSLTALTRICATLKLSPGNVAVLAALPALRELQGVTWTAGSGGALPAVCCPSVTRLVGCTVRHSGLPSLAAAFPTLSTANIRISGGDDGEAPHPAATAPAPAAWHSLESLLIYGLNTLQERHMAAASRSLLSLLRGAGGLTTLVLNTDDDGADLTAWRDADVAALLARAPLSLERLTLYPVAALTDAAFAGCPYRPALKLLELYWTEPPQTMPGGLLALGRALPGLQVLDLGAYILEEGENGDGGEEQRMRAWIEQLDALGGGGGGLPQRCAQPAKKSEVELVLAIRRALAREAAAGVRLA
jgi:hypothetical protein